MHTPPPANERREPSRIDDCVNALIDEGRTLQRLAGVLDRQRLGVSAHDVTAVEETVHAVERILLTAAEARSRRRAVLALADAPEDLPLSALEVAFGDPLPPRLAMARRSLWETAMAVRRDVMINHRLITRALQAGDALLRRMFAAAADPPPGREERGDRAHGRAATVQTAGQPAEAQEELVTTSPEVQRRLARAVPVVERGHR